MHLSAYRRGANWGKPGIVMMVIGQYGANTLTVSRQVEQTLKEFEPVFKNEAITFMSTCSVPLTILKDRLPIYQDIY